MRAIPCAALAAVLLSACAAAPGQGAGTAGPGSNAIAVIGTPFLIALKLPVCIATVVVAGPAGAAAEFASPGDPVGTGALKQALGDGIVENCGPPYVVTP